MTDSLLALEDLELPMCEDCHVKTKVIDLRVSVCERCGAGYGIALLECPSCLSQEQTEVASFEEALLGVDKRIDHRRHTIEEVGFIAVFGKAEERDRPRGPVHRASPPKELVLRAV